MFELAPQLEVAREVAFLFTHFVDLVVAFVSDHLVDMGLAPHYVRQPR